MARVKTGAELYAEVLLKVFLVLGVTATQAGNNNAEHLLTFDIEHDGRDGAPKKVYYCGICGKNHGEKFTKEGLFCHMARHSRDKVYQCDEYCWDLHQSGLKCGENLPEEYQVKRKTKRGRKKTLIPWRTTFRLFYIHMRDVHGVSLKQLRESKSKTDNDRYKKLKTPVNVADLPEDITYDFLQDLAGGKLAPWEYLKVTGCIPSNAKTPQAVKYYVVEWRAQTKKKGKNDITEEPNVINGLFMNTGGAFGVYRECFFERKQVNNLGKKIDECAFFKKTSYKHTLNDFWRLHKKYPQVFSHPSMLYTHESWFTDQ